MVRSISNKKAWRRKREERCKKGKEIWSEKMAMEARIQIRGKTQLAQVTRKEKKTLLETKRKLERQW